MLRSNLVNIMLALTLPIAMLSGLFVAVWVGIILAVILGYYFFDAYKNSNSIKSSFSLSPLEIVIFLYSLSSSIWSIAPKTTVIISLQLVSIILLARFIFHRGDFLSINYKIVVIGMLSAIIIFFIERFSYGYFSKYLRYLTSHPKTYDLSWFDRGCSLLSISTWPIIYMLVKNRKKAAAFLIYILVFITLISSDNTSGLIGFVLASVGYILLTVSKMRLSWLVKFSMILYLIAMPIVSKLEDPRFIAKEYGENIPISYIHRLLIWNFVTNKALDTPIFGRGIGTSKFIPIEEEDHFLYLDRKLSPLPLHPHNNVLQIFLELGVIGVVLFGLYMWKILSIIGNLSLEKSDILWGASSYATFINYFFIGMVSFGIWQSWWMISILFVMILGKKIAIFR